MSTSTEPLGSRNTCDTPSLIFFITYKGGHTNEIRRVQKKYFKEVNDMEKKENKNLEENEKTNNDSRRNHNI